MHLADAFILSNYKLHDYTGYTYIFEELFSKTL